jgi:hypothetical protein
MFKKKQAMKRGGAVKKGKKKAVKKRGGGMMQKMMGGGMMGPKKKLAKGGSLKKVLGRKPPGRLKDDINPSKKAMPTGRSAAAKKAAMKGVKTKSGALLASLKKGKGNPAGKDLSFLGKTKGIRKLIKDMGLRKKRK